VIAGFFVVDISLNLCACFSVLALDLPVKKVSINRVVLKHSGW